MHAALEYWHARGGQEYVNLVTCVDLTAHSWQLIEPVDGFHPNQYAQPLITEVSRAPCCSSPNVARP